MSGSTCEYNAKIGFCAKRQKENNQHELRLLSLPLILLDQVSKSCLAKSQIYRFAR